MKNKQKGQALIEMAFAVIILMMLILGGFDTLLCEIQLSSVNFVTQQAALCLEKPGCNANTYIQNMAPSLMLNPSYLTYNVTSNQVTVTYIYQPVGPDFPKNLKLTATATTP